ncbi:MAG: hypothetical protein ACE5G5_03700, partial [Candidatus Methylomirabilales bacterium]
QRLPLAYSNSNPRRGASEPEEPAFALRRLGRATLGRFWLSTRARAGWRLGASIALKDTVENIANLNVNDDFCSYHFIQYGAIEALTGDHSGPKKIIQIMKERHRQNRRGKIVSGMSC